MAQIKQFVHELIGSVVTADDKNIYFAFGRHFEANPVSLDMQPSANGPDLKLYTLIMTGKNALGPFLVCNVKTLVEKG